MRSPSTVVRQQAGLIVTTEVLAQHIVAISEGIKKLRDGPLDERAILLLLEDACPMPAGNRGKRLGIRDIKAVLDGMERLQQVFVRPRRAPPAAT